MTDPKQVARERIIALNKRPLPVAPTQGEAIIRRYEMFFMEIINDPLAGYLLNEIERQGIAEGRCRVRNDGCCCLFDDDGETLLRCCEAHRAYAAEKVAEEKKRLCNKYGIENDIAELTVPGE